MRFLLTSIAGLCVVACGSDGPTAAELELPGTYSATVFSVVIGAQPPVNVLSAGGSLTLTIRQDGVTSGTLIIPGQLTGAEPETMSMAGLAIRTDELVSFQQSADSFVRDLSWELTTTGLRVVNQVAGSAAFTIVLTRQ